MEINTFIFKPYSLLEPNLIFKNFHIGDHYSTNIWVSLSNSTHTHLLVIITGVFPAAISLIRGHINRQWNFQSD